MFKKKGLISVFCVSANALAHGSRAEGQGFPSRPHFEEVSVGTTGPCDQGEAAAVGPSGAGSEAQSQVCFP